MVRHVIRHALVIGCVTLVGCSTAAERSSESTLVALAVPEATADPAQASAEIESSAPVEKVASAAESMVEFSVQVDERGIDEVVSVTSADASDGDPFATFVSCSGLRTAVGTYSVSAATRTGTVGAVSVLSVDRATTAGIYDAEVRVEPRVGAPISAVGTMTLDIGLKLGTFLAFDLEGNEVSGSFSCTNGTDVAPVALQVGTDDGVLDAIEVIALLRRGDAERVVALAATPDMAGATLRCPGAIGATGPEIVRVDGDERIGSISTFELAGRSAITMRLHVGDAVFDFAAVDATIDEGGTSGVFSAETSDGVTVDGAFRCS